MEVRTGLADEGNGPRGGGGRRELNLSQRAARPFEPPGMPLSVWIGSSFPCDFTLNTEIVPLPELSV